MSLNSRVTFDLPRERAIIGSIEVVVAVAGRDGEIQICGTDGPIIRPLRFGQRTRVVLFAAQSTDPCGGVRDGILKEACVRPGVAPLSVQQILAMVLTGASIPAPTFAETTVLVARSTGWDPAQLDEAEAMEVDRLAIHLGGRVESSDWTQLILADDLNDDLDAIANKLAYRLLSRLNESVQTIDSNDSSLASLRDSATSQPTGQTYWPAPDLFKSSESIMAVPVPETRALHGSSDSTFRHGTRTDFGSTSPPTRASSGKHEGYFRIRDISTLDRSCSLRSELTNDSSPTRSTLAVASGPSNSDRLVSAKAIHTGPLESPRSAPSVTRPDSGLEFSGKSLIRANRDSLSMRFALADFFDTSMVEMRNPDTHGGSSMKHAAGLPSEASPPISALDPTVPDHRVPKYPVLEHPDVADLTDMLAELLHEEADLKGIER